VSAIFRTNGGVAVGVAGGCVAVGGGGWVAVGAGGWVAFAVGVAAGPLEHGPQAIVNQTSINTSRSASTILHQPRRAQ